MADYVIAKYIRLSIEDSKSDSLSIPNQRLLLDQHIAAMSITGAEVREFVDNGCSGTNFERPAVQELLELARLSQVNCVLVKDFSRFGRNAIEVGYFIERVFPLFGIRFISVSDGFDSADHVGDTGGMEVSFKFIMHEYYSRDLSKKIKSAKHEKMRRGEYITKNCAFGYKKVGNQLEIDDPAADTVRLIFRLAHEGKTTSQIRDVLLEAGKATPKLDTSAILKILRDEQYVGTYVAGKTEIIDVGSKKAVPKDESEWVKIPNHHPAIVSQEVFDIVQTRFRKRSKPLSPKKPAITLIESWQEFSRPVLNKKLVAKVNQAMEDRRQAYEQFVMGEICETEYKVLCGGD